MLKEISEYEKIKKDTNGESENNKKVVTQLKENFLEDISQKTMFDELYKY